jgi:hypothetical protein
MLTMFLLLWIMIYTIIFLIKAMWFICILPFRLFLKAPILTIIIICLLFMFL